VPYPRPGNVQSSGRFPRNQREADLSAENQHQLGGILVFINQELQGKDKTLVSRLRFTKVTSTKF
jgi:hypothetical protein